MTTYTAYSTLPDEASAAELAAAVEILEPTGVGCFEIEDGSGLWEVGAYFLDRPDETKLALLAAAHGAKPFVVSRVEDQDWVAQVRRELHPVRAGRFVVHGGHDREAIRINEIGLEIEAAMAFGTGHHATTQGCLLAIDWLRRQGLTPRRVADIGCGTGVLAMGAVKVWPCEAVATDIDGVAVATARANIAFNGLGPRVRVAQAVGYRHDLLRRGAPFDLVLANILARPLAAMAGDAARATAPGSYIVLSGLLTRQEAFVTQRYRAWGMTRAHAFRIGEWTTLVLKRHHKMKGR
ncbi:MAG: 50S ribosomal protein L11 methyltransferase [Neomegalonema sp.]|nr:50S ribosomal protein L11 methyltransferase [Neomegalonema sp.]